MAPSTPRSSEKRVSFAVRLEELSPEQQQQSQQQVHDNQSPPASAKSAEVSPDESLEIPKSLSQIKQEVELSLPKAYTEDSTTGKNRGPWSMTSFIDNLCSPSATAELRGPDDAPTNHARPMMDNDSDDGCGTNRKEPPASPSSTTATVEKEITGDDEDAFLPVDAEEAFLPPQDDTTVGDEDFLPANNAVDESFLEAAFLPLAVDESAFLPPFDGREAEEVPPIAANDSVADESQLAGELVSNDAVTATKPGDGITSPNQENNAVEQQTQISQLEDHTEVELELTPREDDTTESVFVESGNNDTDDGACDEVVEVDPVSLLSEEQDYVAEEDEEEDLRECELVIAEPEVVEMTEDLASNDDDCDPKSSQKDDPAEYLETEEDKKHTGDMLGSDPTATSQEQVEVTGTRTSDQEDVASKETIIDGAEVPPEDSVVNDTNEDNNNIIADEYPALSMEYTRSASTDVASNNDNENASDDGSRDEILEELRVLVAKSEEEKQTPVDLAVTETEIRSSEATTRLNEDSLAGETKVAEETKSQQQELQQQQSTTNAHSERQPSQVEESRPEPVVQTAGAMNVANVVQTKFSDDQEEGGLSTLKNSLGNLLKNQKETIKSLRLTLGKSEVTIEELKTERDSFKGKYKTTQSSLTFAEKTLISLKAERTTAKTETKATIEKLTSKILELESSLEAAKQAHHLEHEQSAATIASLTAALADKNDALNLAKTQLVIMEEQQETIVNLEESVQQANKAVNKAKADSAQIEGQLKVSMEVMKLEAAEKEKQMNEAMEQTKINFEKSEENLKESIAAVQQSYEVMRSLCNQQSSDIMARESTITDLQEKVSQLEATKLENAKNNVTLLKENQRLNSLVEQQQLTIANKERSLDEMKQEIRDLVESVQNADSLREELQAEHEQSISQLNEKVRSLSMDCESLKSIASQQSKASENSDINSVENVERKSSTSKEASTTGSYDTAVEPGKSDSTGTNSVLQVRAEKGNTVDAEVADPMFCSAVSKSGEDTANSGKSLIDQDLDAITTMPSQVCKEQFKKMDSTVQNERRKTSSFNQKISNLTCGCVAGSSCEFPDSGSLYGSNSLVDTDLEEKLTMDSSHSGEPLNTQRENEAMKEDVEVQASQSTESVASVDNRMAGVMFENEEDAVEAVLHLEKCNYADDLSLQKSKSSTSDISSKDSSESDMKRNLSKNLADYVDGGEVVQMTKKLTTVGCELKSALSKDKGEDSPNMKDSGHVVDKVGIFKAAFKSFQSEKDKLLKEAEAEKKKAIDEMRAQLEAEKRAFIEEQEKRYGELKSNATNSPAVPVTGTPRAPKAKPVSRQAKSKSPVRQTRSLSRVSGSPTIEKARAALRPTKGVAKPKVAAPRVPIYLRSTHEDTKNPKPQKNASNTSATRSTSVPKAQSRRPSAIRAPSPSATRPSSLRGTRSTSIRAPSPTSSRSSKLRTPSPGATRLPTAIRVASPSARRSSIRAPSPTNLRVPKSGLSDMKKAGGTGTTQRLKTNYQLNSKLKKPQTGGGNRLYSLAGQKVAKKAGGQPTVDISSLEDSFSSLKKKQHSMTPRKAVTGESAAQNRAIQEKAPSAHEGCEKAGYSAPEAVDDVSPIQSTEDGSELKSKKSKSGEDSVDRKEEPGIEIVFRRPEKSSQDCRTVQSQETADSANVEKRTSVPECLDLLNAEISNSDCDLEDESEEEDTALEEKVMNESKKEVREEEIAHQRGDTSTAREAATTNDNVSDEHMVFNSEQREESAEVDVSLKKINNFGSTSGLETTTADLADA